MDQLHVKTLRIKEIRQETNDFKIFSFEEGHGIRYKAGQYLTLVRYDNELEVRRSYSIVSSPLMNKPLSIGVKRIENGLFSRTLVDNAKVGDALLTSGSGGLFTLPDDLAEVKQVFFFAAGSGITPICSLLKTALKLSAALKLVLVYSNHSQAQTIFYKELQELAAKFPTRLQIDFLFSDSPDLLSARLHRDLILQLLKKHLISSKETTLFYTCGPEAYMRLCTYTLQEGGVPSANIKKENFVTHRAVVSQFAPPDTETHNAFIRLADGLHEVLVNYPDSILMAARKQGIQLPYSCEAGQCGNCVAKCVKGLVWHSYNEVLTEKDLHKGLVLTCVGHPIGGDVTIQFEP